MPQYYSGIDIRASALAGWRPGLVSRLRAAPVIQSTPSGAMRSRKCGNDAVPEAICACKSGSEPRRSPLVLELLMAAFVKRSGHILLAAFVSLYLFVQSLGAVVLEGFASGECTNVHKHGHDQLDGCGEL